MARMIWRWFLILPFLLIACKDDAALRFDLKYEVKKLTNGLTVILVEDHSVPVISYQTWVKVGSVDEQPGKTGLAHLFEHLMFKNTEEGETKSPFEHGSFFRELEAKGAEVNAYTTRDYTVYYENFGAPLLDKTIELESKRLSGFKISQEVMDREIQVVLEERRMRVENSPSGQMEEALWATVFVDHPYRTPVIGYPEDLFTVKLEDLKDFYHRYYHPRNVTIVVTGDIQSDVVFEKIQRAYAPILSRDVPARKFSPDPEQESERRLRIFGEVSSERFIEGYPICAADHSDASALDLLAEILFDGKSSRAYRKLVIEKNMVLGISGVAFTPTFPGVFSITAALKDGVSTAEAEKVLDEVIQGIQKNGVTQEELDQAVRQIAVHTIDGVRTPYGLGNFIGLVQVILGNVNDLSWEVKKYFRVKASEIQRVANQYLQPNRRTTVILVPESKKKDGKFF